MWAVPPSAPPASLFGLSFTVGAKREPKSSCGRVFVGLYLLGGEPSGNLHGASILMNGAGLKHSADATLLNIKDDHSLMSEKKAMKEIDQRRQYWEFMNPVHFLWLHRD